LSVIRRMIESSRQDGAGRAGPAARAFGMAAAEAALEDAGLSVAAAGFAEDVLGPAGLEPLIAGGRLVMRLAKAGSGEPGLAALDPGLLSALIEMTTTGRLRRAPPPGEDGPRPPTPTDAAIAEGFVARFLAGLAARAAGGAPVPAGWTAAGLLLRDRPLELVLPDLPYRACRLQLSVGPEGGRQGEILIAVPRGGTAEGALPGGRRDLPRTAGPLWDARLAELAARAEARLDAVLWRGPMPLAAVADLRPGSAIPIPPDALKAVRMQTLDGRIAMTGRLGQSAGFRALRVTALGPPAAAAGGQGPAPPVPGAAGAAVAAGGGTEPAGAAPEAAGAPVTPPEPAAIGLPP